MKLEFAFGHGLGDCANFAHAVPLLTARGFAVCVYCSADKAPLFAAAGATTAPYTEAGGRVPHHPYLHPAVPPAASQADPWTGNKVVENISVPPLPQIGSPAELWPELVAVRLAPPPGPAAGQAAALLAELPRPVVLVHTRANTTPQAKDVPDEEAAALYDLLLDGPAGSLVLLDWDNRVPRLPHFRVRHVLDDWRGLGLEVLWHLIDQADLLIGVDSGPLHLSRLTKTPALGVWRGHYPSHFALPRDETLHLVPRRHAVSGGDRFRRLAFNTVATAADVPTAADVARWAAALLAGPRYLPATRQKIARDCQLQHLLERCRWPEAVAVAGRPSKPDRHRTFGAALRHLATHALHPRMVETGCIRQEEDWSAGFSTVLLGHYAWQTGGTLDSVELDPERAAFARTWSAPYGLAVTIHTAHSHTWLDEFRQWHPRGAIDLFYSDSADVGTPDYEECCLGEVQRALPLVTPGGLILVDDTVYQAGRWWGKGTLAVPWLLAHGCRVLLAGHQVLLHKPPGPRHD